MFPPVLNISYTSAIAQPVYFELVNDLGQVVYQYRHTSKEGKNALFFYISSLPAGMYVLKIQEGETMTHRKVIIER